MEGERERKSNAESAEKSYRLVRNQWAWTKMKTREREKRVAEYKPSFLTDFRMFNKRHQRVCGFHKSENVNSAFSSAEKACRSLRRVENVPSCITGIKIANCAMDCLPAPSLSLSVSVSMYIYVPVCTYVYTYRRSSLSAIRLVFESLRVLTRE